MLEEALRGVPGRLEAEISECGVGRHAPPGGPHEEALLERMGS